MKKYGKFIIIIGVFLILSLFTVASFAYFNAVVNGNESSSANVITTGNMKIEYVDGAYISTTETMLPGNYVTKNFTIKNVGNLDTQYNIYLVDVINKFVNRSDLVYELTGDNGLNVGESECPYVNSVIASNVSIGVGQEHHYTLKLTFKETNIDQNENLGALFSAKISLNEEANLLTTKIIEQKVLNTTSLDSDYLMFNEYYTAPIVNSKYYNLRYVGADPNNYIYFNCDTNNVDEMNDENCEKWRIIGIFNDLTNQSSDKFSRVKIVRNESIGSYSWDSSDSTINNGNGINQWGTSGSYEGADLMRELNTDYLGDVTVGTDGKWYNGTNNQKDADMPSKVLNQEAIDMIETVKWVFGNSQKMQWNNGYDEVYRYYGYENSWHYNNLCKSSEYCNDTVQRNGYWYGKVGLVYLSDYTLSTGGNENTSRFSCLTARTFNYNQYPDCLNNSWLYDSNINYWSLNCDTHNKYASLADYVNRNGSIYYNNASLSLNVKPSVYLKDEIKVVGGDGTSLNPFKLTK